MTKKELRAAMKKRNLSLSSEERAAGSERIFGRVERLPGFSQARCAAFFCALPDEPQTGAALARWSAAKRIVVPRVEGDAMRFYDYVPGELCRALSESPSRRLRNGRAIRRTSTSSSFREWLLPPPERVWAAAADIMTNICRSPVSGV